MCHGLFFPGKLCIKQPNAGLGLLQVHVYHVLFQEDAPQGSFKIANPSGSQLGAVLSAGGQLAMMSGCHNQGEGCCWHLVDTNQGSC